MRRSIVITAALIALGAPVGAASTGHAQLLDKLKNATGMGDSNGSSVQATPIPSVGQEGASNTAGILQYCVQKNYLSAGPADSVRQSLLTHVPGQSGDASYQQGSQGVLQTGSGQAVNLNGSDGFQQQATQKVCSEVLQHGRTLLG